MRLYERSVDLQLKLDAAQSADTSSELLARGDRLVEALEQAADYFEGAARFCEAAAVHGRPDLDVKAVSQAVAGFRGGISRSSSAAFQQTPASKLQATAKAERERAVRWVSSQWRNLFAEYDPLLDAAARSLLGSAAHRRTAQARASTLRAARSLDPVADAAELGRTLGGADVAAWVAAIRALGTELRDALAAIEAERAALSPEVLDVLRRAGGADGLPLDEVTDDLLATLRRAGVDEHLVVRRR